MCCACRTWDGRNGIRSRVISARLSSTSRGMQGKSEEYTDDMAWHEIAGAESLEDRQAMGVHIGEHPIAVCRSSGELHAVHNICTHQFALLSDGYIEDNCIECPLHQGRFDLKTGAVVDGPVT